MSFHVVIFYRGGGVNERGPPSSLQGQCRGWGLTGLSVMNNKTMWTKASRQGKETNQGLRGYVHCFKHFGDSLRLIRLECVFQRSRRQLVSSGGLLKCKYLYSQMSLYYIYELQSLTWNNMWGFSRVSVPRMFPAFSVCMCCCGFVINILTRKWIKFPLKR